MPVRPDRAAQPPAPRGEAARQGRRCALEDMPMCRHSPAVPPPQLQPRAPAELIPLLERQNALLCDILCAVNGLAAGQLARR